MQAERYTGEAKSNGEVIETTRVTENERGRKLKKYKSQEVNTGGRYREGKAQRENVVCRKGGDETARSKSIETSLVLSVAAEKRSEERSEREG
jgi:hypothetical protein